MKDCKVLHRTSSNNGHIDHVTSLFLLSLQQNVMLEWKLFLIDTLRSEAIGYKYCQEKHLPVVEWIWKSNPISDTKRKVLYEDTVISCRKAVISGGPRQMLSRRAAIPAVNLTSAFLTSAFVPARSATCRLRVSHFICLWRFVSNSDLRFHHVNSASSALIDIVLS